MYNSFFGLTETPFNLTPDPRYLFLSSNHREAIDHLLYGINERKGFILITGDIGAGKTTLCRVLLDRLDEKTKSALIINSFISDTELLELIIQDFGVNIETNKQTTKKDYIDALNHFLLENFSNGGNAVLLIDEAQNLSRDVLEQLRMLSNLETEREKLIQIVLIGQPELKDIIEAPSLRQLNDRIIVRYFLKPLEQHDINGYVEHRLVVAGGHGNLRFTSGAYKRLYTKSNGIPRRINSICDRALLAAYTNETYTVTTKIIQKATEDLYGTQTNNCLPGNINRTRYVSIAILLFLTIAVIAFTLFNNREGFFKQANKKQVEEPKALVQLKDTVTKKNKKVPALFLNREESISGLFSLYYKNNPVDGNDEKYNRLNLVNIELAPEYYIMLKKPFRLKTKGNNSAENYLLITETSVEGATCIDTENNIRKIPRDFILKEWSGHISWIYPLTDTEKIFNIGMKSSVVEEFQRTLQGIGYIVNITGTYDIETFSEIKRFQEDFGLRPDGIAGPKTKALLYQMAK